VGDGRLPAARKDADVVGAHAARGDDGEDAQRLRVSQRQRAFEGDGVAREVAGPALGGHERPVGQEGGMPAAHVAVRREAPGLDGQGAGVDAGPVSLVHGGGDQGLPVGGGLEDVDGQVDGQGGEAVGHGVGADEDCAPPEGLRGCGCRASGRPEGGEGAEEEAASEDHRLTTPVSS
jgi:hypothetical protein